jgi:DNA-binding response OmpR family regulator
MEVRQSSPVLIVDDNANLAYFTAYSLRKAIEGLTVLTAGSCEECLVLADKHHPSVLIVDLKLPDGDGLGLISELKSRSPGAVPILATATPLPDDSNMELFGLLFKPYDPDDLINLVRRALNSGEPQSRLPSGEHHLEAPERPAAEFDCHHVQNRLSGLLAGIRALRLELYAVANDPEEVKRTIDEYTDRLSAMVKDAAESIKRGVGRR